MSLKISHIWHVIKVYVIFESELLIILFIIITHHTKPIFFESQSGACTIKLFTAVIVAVS
jgi:hypothetical protein